MKVYVLLVVSKEHGWDSESAIKGVYSNRTKAKSEYYETVGGVCKEYGENGLEFRSSGDVFNERIVVDSDCYTEIKLVETDLEENEVVPFKSHLD